MEELTITKETALELDIKIKTYANAAWSNLVESCKCLKQMRDTKGYEALGYTTFGEYTEASLNIKERQAYTYISTLENQGERFLQLNANLGITKLALLNAVPVTDREELLENNDIARMSVSEVEALVKENNGKAEQIELLEDEKEELKSELDESKTALDARDAKIRELEQLLEAEKSKPTEVAVREPSPEEIEKIRQKTLKEAEKSFNKKAKAAEEDYKAKLAAAEKDQKEKSDKILAEYKEKVAAADKATLEAVKRAEELEKQLQVSSSAETTRFTFYFDAVQEDLGKIIESINTLKAENSDTGNKYEDAIIKYLKMVLDNLAK